MVQMRVLCDSGWTRAGSSRFEGESWSDTSPGSGRAAECSLSEHGHRLTCVGCCGSGVVATIATDLQRPHPLTSHLPMPYEAKNVSAISTAQQLGLEQVQRRGQRRAPVPPRRRADQAERGIGRESRRVVQVCIATELERLHLMRLELVRLPDAVRHGWTEGLGLGHRPHAPVRRTPRRRVQGQADSLVRCERD